MYGYTPIVPLSENSVVHFTSNVLTNYTECDIVIYMEMKTITLPVLHGATVEWVKAQREEMKARLWQEFTRGTPYIGYKYTYQYSYKNGFPYMTVGLKVYHATE